MRQEQNATTNETSNGTVKQLVDVSCQKLDKTGHNEPFRSIGSVLSSKMSKQFLPVSQQGLSDHLKYMEALIATASLSTMFSKTRRLLEKLIMLRFY